MDWLREYAAGRADNLAAQVRSIADLRQLEIDLDRIAGDWRTATDATPEIRRRALAAFVLDAVNARLAQGARASRLLEWGCRQIRRHNPPDDFDRHWHRAAFALFAGAVDPDGLEAHVAHVKLQFPNEPRLPFERAVASELRAAPFRAGARLSAPDIARHFDEAANRYREAAASTDAATRRDALLRLARVEIERGQANAAIAALDARTGAPADADDAYLAALFRGLALEGLGRLGDAAQAYATALRVQPGRQSASIAEAALWFRQSRRDEANARVASLLEDRTQTTDPWWNYWPADYRYAPQWLATVRQSIATAGIVVSPADAAPAPSSSSGPVAARPAAVATSPVGAPSAASSIASGRPMFRSSVTGVSVSVSVHQNNIRVIGLTAADFELLDNGVPQRISALSVETQPIDVTLLLDLSGSVEGARLERLKLSVAETSRLLKPADQLRLIAVQHQLRQVFGFQSAGTAPNLAGLSAQGGTALVDGLTAAMIRPADPDRRQLIVAYTDGVDTLSILSPAVARDVAGFADALVHVVVPFAGNQRPGSSIAAPFLNDLARRTGGQLFFVDMGAPIADAFKRAIDDFRTSYVLRYTPSGVKNDGWHELTVNVRSGAYEIKARKGYSGL
jgi:VWFA-related protein